MYVPLYIQPVYVALTFTLLPRIEVHVFNLRTSYKLWNILQYKYITRDLLNVICVVANYFRKIGFPQLFNLKWSEHAYSTTETYPHMNLRFKLGYIWLPAQMKCTGSAQLLYMYTTVHTHHTLTERSTIHHTHHTLYLTHTCRQAHARMHARTHTHTHTHSLSLTHTHTHTH